MTSGSRIHTRAYHLRWAEAAAGFIPGAIFLVLAIVLATAPLDLAKAGSLSERFPSNGEYPNGTVVSIEQTTPAAVDLADINNTDFLVGVVEEEGGSLLTISREVGDVSVALNGEVEAFVSDVNGPIAAGDFVGSSWIRGVGMKSLDNTEQKLLGVALEDFNEESADAFVVEGIETPDGERDAKIGKIVVRIFDRQVGADSSESDSTVIERFAARVAGKEVLFARVIAATVLFIVSVVIGGAFLANAIRGSFISLGRNPLASSSIYSSLVQVTGVTIGVVLIGTVLAYAMLVI